MTGSLARQESRLRDIAGSGWVVEEEGQEVAVFRKTATSWPSSSTTHPDPAISLRRDSCLASEPVMTLPRPIR